MHSNVYLTDAIQANSAKKSKKKNEKKAKKIVKIGAAHLRCDDSQNERSDN